MLMTDPFKPNHSPRKGRRGNDELDDHE